MEGIRHWKVVQCSYEECPYSGAATWFIDPPYQDKGIHYRKSAKDIDYSHLAHWCRSRKGQVIVCEGAGANWLPFEPLHMAKTARKGKPALEVVWTKDDGDLLSGLAGKDV